MGVEEFKQFVNPVPYEPQKENCSICQACAKERPVCCQCLPCYISPHDLKDVSVEGIINLLNSGMVSLDWYEGGYDEDSKYPMLMDDTKPHFFLRMRGAGRQVIDPAFGMTCCALWDKDKGCPIEFEYRPKGARELIPMPQSDECDSSYEKDDCAAEWDQYWDNLRIAGELFMASGQFEKIDPIAIIGRAVESLMELGELAYERE